MKKGSLLLLAMFCLVVTGMSQSNEFKPGGKPFMKIFSNYHATFSDGESVSAFELNRLYLGYEYNFSEKFSAKANLDIGDPGAGSLEMTAYVKNAYLKYEEDKFSVHFGLIPTTQFKVQEKAWGYRYIEKSFQDAYKFNSSADLGVSVAYRFSDLLSADLSFVNGEGYKRLQADSTFRTGFGVTLTPGDKVTGRVYYDFISKEETQSSLAALISYVEDEFSLAAEYNSQFNVGFNEDRTLSGTSIYGTLKAASKVKVYARFDYLTSNTLDGASNDWNVSRDGQLYIAGLEYAPVKGVKLAPNFRGWNPADDNQKFSTSLFLNCEIKF